MKLPDVFRFFIDGLKLVWWYTHANISVKCIQTSLVNLFWQALLVNETCIKAALCICWMPLLPKSDWLAMTCSSLHISLWSFVSEPIWKLKAPQSRVAIVFWIFFRCRVSSVAARHTVIDYTTSTLLWIYSKRHRLWLNDNDPDKQLKSVFAARTQHMSDSNDREG